MKIGDFARKYNMNITAVRYYAERSLLTPERKNNQYIFNKSCMEDMEKIIKYKDLRFSLKEIELLFFLEKTSKFKDDTVLHIFSDLLNKKLEELKLEEKNIHETIERLRQEIDNFNSIKYTEEKNPNGIPFTFIPYLYCPVCGTPLDLESASIYNNKISNGDLVCSCGYKSRIENGVMLCQGHTENTPFKVFENIETVVSIAKEYDNEYVSLMDKTYTWMYSQLVEAKHNQYIMAGPFTFNFLLKYCQELDDDTTFLIVDPSIKRISKLQNYMKDFDFQTVFIAGELEHIPVRHECMDIYIDDFSSNNCIFTYSKSPYGSVSKLLKKGGLCIGNFIDYKAAPKSLQSFKKDNPGFISEKMNFNYVKSDIRENKMSIIESKLMGKTSGKETQFFCRHIENEQIPFIGYTACR